MLISARRSHVPFAAAAPFVALAMAGLALSACSSPPTAPSARSDDAAPPATASASATANTIRITDGTLALPSGLPGAITLKGSKGFGFDGRTLSGQEPSQFCGGLNPCAPGATVAFTGLWLGTDLPGTVRVQGNEFEVGTLESPGMYIELTGSFVAPAHVTDTVSVTVPFTATGLLAGAYQLTGRGNVTFTLAWQPFIDGWGITQSSFDFGNRGGSD